MPILFRVGICAGVQEDHTAVSDDPRHLVIFFLWMVSKDMPGHDDIGKIIRQGDLGDCAVQRKDVVQPQTIPLFPDILTQFGSGSTAYTTLATGAMW